MVILVQSLPALVRTLGRGLCGLTLLLLAWLLLPTTAVLALSANDLPSSPPQTLILDQADLLSRAAQQDIERRLQEFGKDHVEAHLITVNRLDYGLDLQALASEVANRWAKAPQASGDQLLIAIDAQTITAAVAASDGLLDQLPASLLNSVAGTTMAVPLREGSRYRQASLEALDRLETVLQGGEDPGPPQIQSEQVAVTNVPTKEETAESNAFTWVAVLLIVGTVVPMLTWWVFSR